MDLLTIFTSEDKEEIKREVKRLIIERVESDLEHYDQYLVWGANVSDMLSGVLEECREIIKKETLKKARKALAEKLGD